MKEVKRCTECGNRAPVHVGLGNKHWCKGCAHLAPATPKPHGTTTDDGRKRIKWKIGEEKNGEDTSSM